MTAAAPVRQDERARRHAAVLPYLMLSLTMLCWAGNWVVGRAVRGVMPPVALTFWRWSIAALLLAPFVLPRLRGKWPVLRQHWRALVILGFTGVALFQFLIYFGLRLTTSVNGMLMNSAMPLFILVIAWLVDRDTVSPRQLAGMILSFTGILVILNHGEVATLRHFSFNPGDLLILAGMPVWGIYSVALRRAPRELDGLSLVFVVAVIGIAFLLPAYLVESAVFQPVQLSWPAIASVLYVAVLASIVAYLGWNGGVARIGPNRAGFTVHLLPAFGTVLAIIFLGEEVHLFHAVGIAAILMGVWLASSARRAR
jgi:drug/metabolite transporter (DMT)-like permease